MSATKPCVRCGTMPEDHPAIYDHAGLGDPAHLRRCPSYVQPAPWWMLATTRLLDAISRRFVR